MDPEMQANRSAHVIGAAVVLLILPTVAVTLRLLSRWMSRAGFWVDDYVIVLAMVISWGPNVTNLFAIQHGFGKHMASLPNASASEWFKCLYAFEFLYTLGMTTVKYSVDFWETLAGALPSKRGGRCINVQSYFLSAGAINTITDFVLLALPIPILWHLRTGTRQKVLLTLIFTVGLTVCIVSVIRLVVLSQVNTSDITWNYVPAACWSAAEPSIAVVSACLPSLRPLFVRLIWHRPKPSSSNLPSWRNSNKKHIPLSRNGSTQGSFNRLHEFEGRDEGREGPWRTNSVTVFGGKGKRGSAGDEVVMEEDGEVPSGRIRARTEVVLTVSERVDWRDDLF
ncbi:MAG: hypothetical protein Q9170_008072 [Blastenia crenularia]